MIPLGILAAQAPPAPAGAYELISTTILTGSVASVEFAAIPSTYKHLQIRYTAKGSASGRDLKIRFNNVSTSSYAMHFLRGDTSSVQSFAFTGLTGVDLNTAMAESAGTDIFTGGKIDILDYASASKNTTLRALYGYADPSVSRSILLSSGFLNSTAAVTSIQIIPNSGNLVARSRFSLYGIRG
jgi:hypothetical protein